MSILHQNLLLPLLLGRPACDYVLATGTDFSPLSHISSLLKDTKVTQIRKNSKEGFVLLSDGTAFSK